ncbi:MAG: DUF1573 domain-containing protein [Nitrospiraceae bacterium]|nr:MAG: DUF1573 domain-containing protein [Nitrospiraceae bacterium]
MKVIKAELIAFFLIICIWGFNPAETFSAKISGPDIVVGNKSYDFGIIAPGKRIKKVIPVKNAGSGPLNVRLVRSSFERRIAARLSDSVIQPGHAAELIVDLGSSSWESGLFSEHILLYSNDPDGPLIKINIKGNIQSPIVWLPKILQTSVHRSNMKPFDGILIKKGEGPGPGKIHVTSFVPYLSAEVQAEANGDSIIKTSLDPDVPLGEFLGYINIETEHPQLASFQVPVRIKVMGDLVTQPDRLDFGIVEEGKPAQARILLRNQGSRDTGIVKIEPHLPAKAEISVDKIEKDYRITVLIPAPPPLQNLKGHINIFTDHPDEPVVQVPASGWTLSSRPFDVARSDEDNSRLLGLVKAALFDDRISPEDFIEKILGGGKDDRAVSLLLEAYSKENWLIRSRSVEILGALGNMKAVDFVRNAVTQDTDEQVRLAAITALASLVGTEALPELLLALQDDDEWVREDAATLLGKLKDKRAINALSAALSDEEEDVRAAVEAALKILKQESNKPDK